MPVQHHQISCNNYQHLRLVLRQILYRQQHGQTKQQMMMSKMVIPPPVAIITNTGESEGLEKKLWKAYKLNNYIG